MEPKVWGPGAWLFLHSITLNYPENPTDNDKMFHKNFFLNLQNVLPCPSCAQHYSMNLKKFPIDPALESRELLVKWLIDIHNDVNIKNNKPVWSYADVYNKYQDMYNPPNTINNILIFFIISIVLIFLFFLFNIYYGK